MLHFTMPWLPTIKGSKSVAKTSLNQLKATHPTWNKMDEVNFWMGKIHLDERDYFQALKIFATVQDKKIQQDINAAKRTALSVDYG